MLRNIITSRRTRQSVRDVIGLLVPRETGHSLIRLGRDRDGGYLVPDDLAGVGACFSPGVDRTAVFERDLEKRGIPSFMADRTVATLPDSDLQSASFLPLHVGPHDDDGTIEINRWIATSLEGRDIDGDLILQMDIEGAEYATLLALTQDHIQRFRIIVVELHHLHSLGNRHFRNLVHTLLTKLRQHFVVAHIHPNNATATATVGGFKVPRLLEVTFLRKDRATRDEPVETLPHPLDRPNDPVKADIRLPAYWLDSAD